MKSIYGFDVSDIHNWEKLFLQTRYFPFDHEKAGFLRADIQSFEGWVQNKKEKSWKKDRVSRKEVQDFFVSRGYPPDSISRWIQFETDGAIDIAILLDLINSSEFRNLDSLSPDVKTLGNFLQSSRFQPGPVDVFVQPGHLWKPEEIGKAIKETSLFSTVHPYLQPMVLPSQGFIALQSSVLAREFATAAALKEEQPKPAATDCVTTLEVSSIPKCTEGSHDMSIENLLDGDPSTYWVSNGHLGTHWVLIKCRPEFAISSIFISVNSEDASYKPHIIEIKGSDNTKEFRKQLASAVIPLEFTGEYEVHLNLQEHVPYIKLCIMKCHSDGNDVRIRGVRAVGIECEPNSDRSSNPENITVQWYLDLLLAVVEESSPLIPALQPRVLDICRKNLDKLPCLMLSQSQTTSDSIASRILSKEALDRVEHFLLKLCDVGAQQNRKEALKLLSKLAASRGSLNTVFAALNKATLDDVELWDKEEWESLWQELNGKVFVPQRFEEIQRFNLDKDRSTNASMNDWKFTGNGREVIIFLEPPRAEGFFIVNKLKFQIDSSKTEEILLEFRVHNKEGSQTLNYRPVSNSSTHTYVSSAAREYALNATLKGSDRLEIRLMYTKAGQPLILSKGQILGVSYRSPPYINVWQGRAACEGNLDKSLCFVGALLEHDYLLIDPKLGGKKLTLAKDFVPVSELLQTLKICFMEKNKESLPLYLHILHLLMQYKKINLEAATETDRENLQEALLKLSQQHDESLVDEKQNRSIQILAKRALLDGTHIFLKDIEERRCYFINTIKNIESDAFISSTFQGLCKNFTLLEKNCLFNYSGLESEDSQSEDTLRDAMKLWNDIISATFTFLAGENSPEGLQSSWINLVNVQIFELFVWITGMLKKNQSAVRDETKAKASALVQEVVTDWNSQLEQYFDKSEKLPNNGETWQFIGNLYQMVHALCMNETVNCLQDFMKSSKCLESFHSLITCKKFREVIAAAGSELQNRSQGKAETLKTWKVESQHSFNPYARNAKLEETFVLPGSEEFEVEFSPRCDLDCKNGDQLVFCSSDGSQRCVNKVRSAGNAFQSDEWPEKISIRSQNALRFFFKFGNQKQGDPPFGYDNSHWGYSFSVTAKGPLISEGSPLHFTSVLYQAAALYCAQCSSRMKDEPKDPGSWKEIFMNTHKKTESTTDSPEIYLFEKSLLNHKKSIQSTIPDSLSRFYKEIFIVYMTLSTEKAEKSENSAHEFSVQLTLKLLASKQQISVENQDALNLVVEQAYEKVKFLRQLSGNLDPNRLQQTLTKFILSETSCENDWNQIIAKEEKRQLDAEKSLELLISTVATSVSSSGSVLGLFFIQSACQAGFGIDSASTTKEIELIHFIQGFIFTYQIICEQKGHYKEAMLWEECIYNLITRNQDISLITLQLALAKLLKPPEKHIKPSVFQENEIWADRYRLFADFLVISSVGEDVRELLSSSNSETGGYSDVHWFLCLHRATIREENNSLACSGCGISIYRRHIYRCLDCADMNLCKSCFENGLYPWTHSHSHGLLLLTHQCDVCGGDIPGTRYHCRVCTDYDICFGCREIGCIGQYSSIASQSKGHSDDHEMEEIKAIIHFGKDPEWFALERLSKARMWLTLQFFSVKNNANPEEFVDHNFTSSFNAVNQQTFEMEMNAFQTILKEAFNDFTPSLVKILSTHKKDATEVQSNPQYTDEDFNLWSCVLAVLQEQLEHETPSDEEIRNIEKLFGLLSTGIKNLGTLVDTIPEWVSKLFILLKELCHGPTTYPAIPLFVKLLIVLGPKISDSITNGTFGNIVADVLEGYVTLNFLFSVGVWSMNNQEIPFATLIVRSIHDLHESSTEGRDWDRALKEIFKDKLRDSNDPESRFFALLCLAGTYYDWQPGSAIQYCTSKNRWKKGVALDHQCSSVKYIANNLIHAQQINLGCIKPSKLLYSDSFLKSVMNPDSSHEIYSKFRTGKLLGLDTYAEQLLLAQTSSVKEAGMNYTNLREVLTVASSPTGFQADLTLPTVGCAAKQLIGIGSKDFGRAATKIKDLGYPDISPDIKTVIDSVRENYKIPECVTLAIYEFSKDKTSNFSATDLQNEIHQSLMFENAPPLDVTVLLRALNNSRKTDDWKARNINLTHQDLGLAKTRTTDNLFEGTEIITAVLEPPTKAMGKSNSFNDAEDLLFAYTGHQNNDSDEEQAQEPIFLESSKKHAEPNENFRSCLLLIREIDTMLSSGSLEEHKKRDLLKEITNKICRALIILRARQDLVTSLFDPRDADAWKRFIVEKNDVIIPLANLLGDANNQQSVMEKLLDIEESGKSLISLVQTAAIFVLGSVSRQLGTMKIPGEAGIISEGRIRNEFHVNEKAVPVKVVKITYYEDPDGVLLLDQSRIFFAASPSGAEFSVPAKTPNWDPVYIAIGSDMKVIIEYDVKGETYDPGAKPYGLRFEAVPDNRFNKAIRAFQTFISSLTNHSTKCPEWTENARKALDVAWVSCVGLACQVTRQWRLELISVLIQLLKVYISFETPVNLEALHPLRKLKKSIDERKENVVLSGKHLSWSPLQAACTELFFTAESVAQQNDVQEDLYQPLWNPDLKVRIARSLASGCFTVGALGAAIDHPNQATALLRKRFARAENSIFSQAQSDAFINFDMID